MNERMYTDNESLFISIRNLDRFKELIERAKKQTTELEKTIDELNNYDLNIHFETKKKPS